MRCFQKNGFNNFMSVAIPEFTLIEDQQAISRFGEENQSITWLGFDTEFVGEKRFFTRLCLIQVITENGLYLIDPFKVKDMQVFLDMVTDPDIIKITHAGDNDYRLLQIGYGIIPKNVFDTQIAAGYVGYNYPVSFRKLVEGELGIFLAKGYAVADWEERPFKSKQLKYALNDVVPLYKLWKQLDKKLQDADRGEWAKQEFSIFEDSAFYEKDVHKEALGSNLMRALKTKERVFLMRLFAWRNDLAREKNYSKEMILPGKMISQIVRTINAGKEALRHNRRIPGRVAEKYGDTFVELFEGPITEEEKDLLKRIPSEVREDPAQEVLLEMLYLLIKYRCMEKGVAPSLVFSRAAIKRLIAAPDATEHALLRGWRKELIGEQFVEWLLNFDRLYLEIEGGNIQLRLKA